MADVDPKVEPHTVAKPLESAVHVHAEPVPQASSFVQVQAPELLDMRVPGGAITWGGVRLNVSVALQYIAAWLAGTGAVAIYNLMEDAATAEISRAQLWQWIHLQATLDDGRPVDRQLYETARADALAEIRALPGVDGARLDQATSLLDQLVLARDFVPFLTIPGYELLD